MLRRYFGKINFLSQDTYVGKPGELVVDNTTGSAWIMDGVTPGGLPLQSGNAVVPTSGTTYVGNVAPNYSEDGTLWWNPTTGNQSVFYANNWVPTTATVDQPNAHIATGSLPPNMPELGDLWWDSTSGDLYVYYSGTWIPAVASAAGGDSGSYTDANVASYLPNDPLIQGLLANSGSGSGTYSNANVASYLPTDALIQGILADLGSSSLTVGATQTMGDDSSLVFQLAHPSTTDSTFVALNGIIQAPNLSYAVSGNILTFTEAPTATDIIDIRAIGTGLTMTGGSVADSVVDVVAPAGTVVYDCSYASVFYHTGLTGNWNANLTNLGLNPGQTRTITLVLAHGAVAYVPTMLVNGASPGILKSTASSSPANSIQTVTLTVLNRSGSYVVLQNRSDTYT